ncbi:hypothetical protein ABI59_15890 [Acidobacteria bacterium Mor1]|nr:hypothetical protein ABI59_15890 [Acidobacteria bacterium Mor1]
MSVLIVTDREGKSRRFELDYDRRYTIGRSLKNDVVLLDDLVSRKHADLYHEGGFWMLRDNRSSNGTYIDGQRLEGETQLEDHSQVMIGNCRLRLNERSSKSISFSDRPLHAGTVVISANDLLRDTKTGEKSVKNLEKALERLKSRFRVIERANLELLAHEPLDVLFPRILDLVVEAVSPERAALLIRSETGDWVCQAYRGDAADNLDISQTILKNVAEKRVAVLTSDALTDFAEGESIHGQGIRAIMAVPIWNLEEVNGLIYVDSRMGGTIFTDEDLKLLTMLGNVAAIQLQNAQLFQERVEKERFERDAQSAAEIQRGLLPQATPAIGGYAFLGHNTPCYEVGGDYYDMVPLDDHRHCLILADVAGKGMSAALLMASIQAAFHARVEVEHDLAHLAQDLNNALCRTAPSNRFVTLFLAELDTERHRLRYVNAGHAPFPLIVRKTGVLEELPACGFPIGIYPDFAYEQSELQLAQGDLLFACSDGVTDAFGTAEDQDGIEILSRLLESGPRSSASAVRDLVEGKVSEALARSRQPDDLTYLVLQRES